MKPTLPNSNSVVLSGREWLIAIGIFLAVSFTLYFGWHHWERLPLEKDYRSTCWGERMSDYWAYSQWARVARAHYRILQIGSSVVWGQEVPNTETISHSINSELGRDEVANLGIDGLTNAAMVGLFTHYGRYLRDANIILEFNPLWMSSPRRDLRGRGNEVWQFHHPRLVPQFDRRISYYRGFGERLGYAFEHRLRLPPFVRHLMVNYFENKSIGAWLLDHPCRLPPAAITFTAPPMMKDRQGLGTPWSSRKDAAIRDDPFLPIGESVQWEFYLKALSLLKGKGANFFILLGPYNSYCLTEASRGHLFAMMDEVKKKLDELGYPYFDATRDLLPSAEFADQCHLLRNGHALLAKALVKDAAFQRWLARLR
ncbi:MAG: hypothetical protein A2W03_14830 [Candidatus Aminicenantes bacterium RBG_16_63_16]|nr:MAG: hypothetical protein A2W03_14830 [Candidatus Aminicenantes bacterium RBG_16_63_16]